jgi:hypothetical protein
MGGCCSLFASIIVWTFVGFQVYGLISEPGFIPFPTDNYGNVNFITPAVPLGKITPDES